VRPETTIRDLLAEIPSMVLAGGVPDALTRTHIVEFALRWALGEASLDQLRHALTSGRTGQSWSVSTAELLWAKENAQGAIKQLQEARDMIHRRQPPAPQ
jgi:hypothetical protein